MATYATNRYPGNGVTTTYEISFTGGYIDRSHVKAYHEDDATKTRVPVAITSGQWLNDYTIQGFAPVPVGRTMVIYRDTPKQPLVDFVNGARFTEYNMDLVARQGLFVAMEAMDATDAESRDELLEAIENIMALFHDLDVAVSSAQAAALSATGSAAAALSSANAAASSASAASTSASAASTARTGAETARTQAETARTQAATSATSASNSAAAASTSATAADGSKTAAAASAATATTQAGLANSRATDAQGSATAAANSAAGAAVSAAAADIARAAAEAAAGSAVSTPLMACCLVYGGAPRIVSLRRWGGNTILIGGVPRTLPESGLNITANTDATTVYNVYAHWTGSAVAVLALINPPTWHAGWGYWVRPGNDQQTYVGSFVGGLIDGAPMEYIRSAYHGPTVITQADGPAGANFLWGAVNTVISRSVLLLPGDGIEATVNGTTVSSVAKGTVAARHILKSATLELHRVDTGWPSSWQYIPVSCQWALRRATDDPPSLFNLSYVLDASAGTGGNIYCERSRLLARTHPLFR